MPNDQLELKMEVIHLEYLRDPNPCLALYGVASGEICRDCEHLVWYQRRKRFYKCELRKITHGPATDHKVRWQACGAFERRNNV